MKVLIVSSEVVPFSKTGGLADVAGILPLAIREVSGCDARVISPFYKMVKEGECKTKKLKDVKGASAFGVRETFELFESENNGVKFYFVGKDQYYNRDGLYGTAQGGYDDNAARYSFFCRAAFDIMIEIGFYPDIIHLNDWHTALMPLYKNTYFRGDCPLRKTKTLFSIHNLGYQGVFKEEAASHTHLPEKLLEPLMYGGYVNLIKAGILYSDAVSTVSKRYAEEILTPEYGYGLDNELRKRKKDLYGVLNGVDYSSWNPQTDKLIPANYDIETLERKMTCKTELLKRMKIDIPPTAPLIGSVGRLAEQKGIDLIINSIEEIVKSGAGFVLLGTGEERYESTLRHIAEEKAGKLAVSIGFDNKLAHMIEAGSDMFVMPSRYEPCGLNQMYSLKYGTIPVVRATGGLDDTIIDYSKDRERGNGFKFEKAETEDFVKAIKRAIKVFGDKKEWLELQKRGMASDFSWKHAAREYLSIYEKMIR